MLFFMQSPMLGNKDRMNKDMFKKINSFQPLFQLIPNIKLADQLEQCVDMGLGVIDCIY